MTRFLTLGAAILALTAAAFTSPDYLTRSADEATRADALRITAHLRTVEVELLAADISGLSPDQLGARARNIAVLREYRTAGVYPHNHDYPDGRRPYFRDEHGTLCAMAFLIWRSGERELVERVAQTNNNAYIRDLAADPALVAWLDRNGLSVAEAARIQPTYQPAAPESRVSTAYATVTAFSAVAQGAAVAWNLLENPGKSGRLEPGMLALLTGGFGFALGYGARSGGDQDLSGLNLGLGAVTAAVGVVNIVRALNGRSGRATPATESAAKSVRLSPALNTDLSGRTQLGLNLRF